MMPLTLILRKCIGGYKCHKSQDKNQPPNAHGKHQAVLLKWKRTGDPITGNEYIQLKYRDRIWHRKMGHANKEKWKTT